MSDVTNERHRGMKNPLPPRQWWTLRALFLWCRDESGRFGRGASTANVSASTHHASGWVLPHLKALQTSGLAETRKAPNGHDYWWPTEAGEGFALKYRADQ